MAGNNSLDRALKNIVFFLDIFLALLLVVSSSFLIRTSFGRAALAFGFLMICATTFLKFIQKW